MAQYQYMSKDKKPLTNQDLANWFRDQRKKAAEEQAKEVNDEKKTK